jgi:hypothetical protein
MERESPQTQLRKQDADTGRPSSADLEVIPIDDDGRE